MCTDCGCALSKTEEHLPLAISLLAENQQTADANRSLFKRHGITVINIMSSPGSGKTKLLEATLDGLNNKRCAVIVGDLQTDNDAQRLKRNQVQVIQITTGHACHLDASMIQQVLAQLPLDQLDILFIENVGNLVCPADFDLGQDKNVVLISTTEGDDKPCKYPAMFRAADLVVMSKSDLLPYLDDFKPERLQQHLQKIGAEADLLPLSAQQDITPFLNYLQP
jgi:hydrogenase nickel incorporation protein HypB